MRLHILPATVGGTPGQPLSGYVLDGRLAIDAGPLGMAGTVEDQANIRDILLTHSHIDHTAGLPVFLDNVYGLGDAPAVHGSAATLDSLRRDLFNGRVMPDFVAMSERMRPFVRLNQIEVGEALSIGPYRIAAWPLIHSVPTLGFVVDDGSDAFALFTDTGPVPDLIDRLAEVPNLRAVFLECSFPCRCAELAETSFHYTTEQFAAACRRMPAGVMAYPIHVKPRFRDEIREEIAGHGLANCRWIEPGAVVEIKAAA